jgi:polysaccharide export outer membrane protein
MNNLMPVPKNKIIIILIITTLASCVSNKKTTYLQSEYDLYGPAPLDTITAEHELVEYHYKLQHEDAVNVQIKSLTPRQYDFFSLALPTTNVNIGSRHSGALYGYLIDEDGDIEFPVVGKVKLGGLTVFEAERKIQELAENYLEEPVVRVRLVNYRFTVLGEVSNEITQNTYNNRISILEAIGLAGGLNELADRSNVKVIRQYENGVSVHYVNLLQEDLLVESPFYYVYQNDVIIVPPLKQRPFRIYFGQNLGLIISSLSLIILTLNLIAVSR